MQVIIIYCSNISINRYCRKSDKKAKLCKKTLLYQNDIIQTEFNKTIVFIEWNIFLVYCIGFFEP